MANPTLLLLRHGIAEQRRPGLEEGARALTERGRCRTRQVLERLVQLQITADRLLCSPLLRARQTAQIAVETGWAPSQERETALAPGADALAALPAWLERLAAMGPGSERLALVGHEPDLSMLAARLIGAPATALQLRKAGLIQLELPAGAVEGRAVLVTLLRPAVLIG